MTPRAPAAAAALLAALVTAAAAPAGASAGERPATATSPREAPPRGAPRADGAGGTGDLSFDLVVRGGRIVDGTGNPWYAGDVGVTGDRIAAVGDLSRAAARTVLDAKGRVVSPGFIDMLGQSEYTVLVDPLVLSKITQGITTELTGEGSSVAPMTAVNREQALPSIRDLPVDIDWTDLAGYERALARRGTAINFAHLVGAAQVREAVLADADRDPTPAELDAMRRPVADTMSQGAFGLSSALIYPPGAFAKTKELIELATIAARSGGFYATHMRDEGDGIVAALDEAAAIGREAGLPVEIWHLKADGRRNWGRMPEILARIQAIRAAGVDMTADVYPYPAALTGLAASLPPSASEGGVEALVARLKDPASRAALRRRLTTPGAGVERVFEDNGGPQGLLIVGVKTEANRKYQGKRLSEIAAMRGVDPLEAMFDLLVEEGGTVDTIYFDMSEDDVRAAVAAPFVSFDCDASGVRPDGPLSRSLTHPRAYGSFPRVLGRYVRDEKRMSLEDAVRRMTSLPAQRIGLRDRGVLRPGMAADLVVFDPAAVADRATFEDPHRLSVGILDVVVNGRPVLLDGRPTGERPGRLLHGPGYRPAPGSSR